MQEDFLHFIYKHKLWTGEQLFLSSGESLEILNVGLHNFDSGPDFFNAQIKIGDTIWAGNVEIHINSSDWDKHNHGSDFAYNNVVLHIVYNHDKEISLPGGGYLPVWQMEFSHVLFNKYSELKLVDNVFACSEYFQMVDQAKKNIWFEKMGICRLESKTSIIKEIHKNSSGDWEYSFYIGLAKSFGFGINSYPFEELAKSVPLKILLKYASDPFKIEAILFGQSGMFEISNRDNYMLKLLKEYKYLRKLHDLKPIKANLWKKSKMRPSNFPQVRIAQFASLMRNFSGLFSLIVRESSLGEISDVFKIQVSDYWNTHYVFGKPVEKAATGFGKQSKDVLLINTIAPFVYFYHKEMKEDGRLDTHLYLWNEMKPENNRAIRAWSELGLNPSNAFETQSLLHLKKNYCDSKKCLQCAIGLDILQQISQI